MISVLNKDQIRSIKECGKILARVLNQVVEKIEPGIKTRKLGELTDDLLKKEKAKPAFKGFFVEGAGKFPASLCISVNHHLVHGLPSDYIIQNGDVVSLDIGAKYKGMFCDMAVTVGVGEISREAKELLSTTKKCLDKAIEVSFVGNTIGDIGYIVQKTAEEKGFGVVRDLVGHGIGKKLHMPPKVPNFGESGSGKEIVDGMALAIEPMITAGDYKIKTLPDGWTIATFDSSLAAHFEHTIVIENGKATIITIP